MTKIQLENANIEFCKQAELDMLNIHNQLKQDHRQSNETIYDYEKRLAAAQFFRGYDENDYIYCWPTFSKFDSVKAKKYSLDD